LSVFEYEDNFFISAWGGRRQNNLCGICKLEFVVSQPLILKSKVGIVTTRERGVLSSVLDITSFKYRLLSKV